MPKPKFPRVSVPKPSRTHNPSRLCSFCEILRATRQGLCAPCFADTQGTQTCRSALLSFEPIWDDEDNEKEI